MFRIALYMLLIIPNLYTIAQNQEYIQEQYSIAREHHLENHKDSVIHVLHSLSSYLDQNNDSELFILEKAYLYDTMGFYFYKYGEWIKSGELYNKGLQLLHDLEGNYDVHARLNLHLGMLYFKLGDPNAKFYFDLAEELALELQDNEVLFALFEVTNRIDEGIRFAKRNNNNKYLSNYYYLNARDYLDINLETSKMYFDSAKFYLPELKTSRLQHFQYHAFLTDYFLYKNQTDSALSHCEKLTKLIPFLNDIEVEYQYFSCLSSVFLAKKDTSKYLEYYNRSIEIQDYYSSPKVRYRLSELDHQRRHLATDQQIIFLQKRETFGYIIIISLIVILIIILVFMKKIHKINQQLKTSNDTRDRLFSIISHDLRGVISSLNLLAQETSEDNMRRIRTGSDTLLIEFDNLLYWSSQHLDNIRIFPEVIDLNEIIDEVIHLLEGQINDKKQRIIYHYSDDCVAFADHNTVRVVLRNILHNAIKYSPENSEIDINITERKMDTRIDISDMGGGFVDHPSSKGLGLGLDLCYDFVKLNKGKLLIDSNKSGSCISIVLPVDESTQ